MISSFITLVLLFSAPAQSDHINDQAHKQKIIWLVEDKLENRDLLAKTSADTSTASYIENVIIQRLSQYNIKIERVTASRMNRVLQTNENACVANRASTPERREYSLFSDPQSFYLTHKLYRFNQASALPKQLFNAEGEIKDLASVFKLLPEKTLGLAQDVSFGVFLDKQIQKIKAENIYYRGGNKRVVALSSMLYKSRVDFVLALPVDITPNEAQKPLIEQYTIAGAPPYLIAHFNCSKTSLGQRVIDDINQILTEIYQTKDYYRAHKKWFSAKQLDDLQIFLAKHFSEQRYINPTK
ncbi:ABC-type transporter, periplasmic subunit family 3 [Colwellia psychrerythraea]|uniref:ABC-type transporter, periplasmic subunit family 3 n=2 Tax=Colwellia psychrerythraea TaxID=28229 RepID=A0A099KLC2_COLPS|nr:ABC-type transporter, periplasmic subunit family 3 [Colwellia psychrerythraea]